MRIEIFDKPSRNEATLRLKLVSMANGCVVLRAVNEIGQKYERGDLLYINPGGSLVLPHDINEWLGLKLTRSGQMEVTSD
jgi:hypothetical protein